MKAPSRSARRRALSMKIVIVDAAIAVAVIELAVVATASAAAGDDGASAAAAKNPAPILVMPAARAARHRIRKVPAIAHHQCGLTRSTTILPSPPPMPGQKKMTTVAAIAARVAPSSKPALERLAGRETMAATLSRMAMVGAAGAAAVGAVIAGVASGPRPIALPPSAASRLPTT
jgi:hypothetical protein